MRIELCFLSSLAGLSRSNATPRPLAIVTHRQSDGRGPCPGAGNRAQWVIVRQGPYPACPPTIASLRGSGARLAGSQTFKATAGLAAAAMALMVVGSRVPLGQRFPFHVLRQPPPPALFCPALSDHPCRCLLPSAPNASVSGTGPRRGRGVLGAGACPAIALRQASSWVAFRSAGRPPPRGGRGSG